MMRSFDGPMYIRYARECLREKIVRMRERGPLMPKSWLMKPNRNGDSQRYLREWINPCSGSSAAKDSTVWISNLFLRKEGMWTVLHWRLSGEERIREKKTIRCTALGLSSTKKETFAITENSIICRVDILLETVRDSQNLGMLLMRHTVYKSVLRQLITEKEGLAKLMKWWVENRTDTE